MINETTNMILWVILLFWILFTEITFHINKKKIEKLIERINILESKEVSTK